ncbi:hypothetical protein ACFX11_014943 [Malus domestica]
MAKSTKPGFNRIIIIRVDDNIEASIATTNGISPKINVTVCKTLAVFVLVGITAPVVIDWIASSTREVAQLPPLRAVADTHVNHESNLFWVFRCIPIESFIIFSYSCRHGRVARALQLFCPSIAVARDLGDHSSCEATYGNHRHERTDPFLLPLKHRHCNSSLSLFNSLYVSSDLLDSFGAGGLIDAKEAS